MSILQINSYKLYYEVHGEGEPLILISGLTRDYQNWKYMLPKLSQLFKVIVFDNRGVGQFQELTDDFELEDIAKDITFLLNFLGIKKVNIFGHSLGGMVGQIMAVNYKEYVNKLILANTLISTDHFVSLVLESFLIVRRKTSLSLDDILSLRLPWIYSSAFLSESYINLFKQEIIEHAYPQSLTSYERQINAIEKFDFRDSVNKINADTLVIGSEEDVLTNTKLARTLYNSINKARLEIIPGGHCSQIECPDILNELIINFIKHPL